MAAKYSTVVITLVAIALVQNASAQFSSTANILSMTQTWNQNLWSSQASLQKTIERGEALGAGTYSAAPASAPYSVAPRFPVNATDFQGMPWREVPERLLASIPESNNEQRVQTRLFYHRLLDSYELGNRRQNVAGAVAYSIGTSLEITRVKALSPVEAANLFAYVNEAVAGAPQFRALTPQQKQILYESSVISGGIARALFVEGTRQNDPGLRRQAGELARTIIQQWAGGS